MTLFTFLNFTYLVQVLDFKFVSLVDALFMLDFDTAIDVSTKITSGKISIIIGFFHLTIYGLHLLVVLHLL